MYDLIVLVGYSPIFVELGQVCKELGIDIAIIASPRQRQDIESIDTSDVKQVLFSEDFRDLRISSLLGAYRRILGYSKGAPFLFKQRDIDMFSLLLNSHGAPLPEYKGGGGFSWRILQGDKRGAVLIHQIDESIDEGPVLFREEFKFPKEVELPVEYEKYQLAKEIELVLPWFKKILTGNISIRELEKRTSKESYFPRLSTDHHSFIDWSMGVDECKRFIQAFSTPYRGAQTFVLGRKVRILNCKVIERSEYHPFYIGLIGYESVSAFDVFMRDGILRILKKDMTFEDEALKSSKLCGERLITPRAEIEKALSTRVYWTPSGIRAKSRYEP